MVIIAERLDAQSRLENDRLCDQFSAASYCVSVQPKRIGDSEIPQSESSESKKKIRREEDEKKKTKRKRRKEEEEEVIEERRMSVRQA